MKHDVPKFVVSKYSKPIAAKDHGNAAGFCVYAKLAIR
jgi:hypothetical protein